MRIELPPVRRRTSSNDGEGGVNCGLSSRYLRLKRVLTTRSVPTEEHMAEWWRGFTGFSGGGVAANTTNGLENTALGRHKIDRSESIWFGQESWEGSMLDKLLAAVRTASALRSPAALAPTVPGARVMPPTFPSKEKGRPNEYLKETRVTANGEKTDAVVLDTLTSSANRVEEALLDAIEEGELSIADLRIRVGEFGEVSTLQLPHRVFDAYLLEGLLDGKPFPKTELGRSLSESTTRDATAIFLHSPTSLLFGAWDSHGDR
ncbi:MAG: type I-U CRISPR-associated RAMP protein Csb1/Cas7u, partial [Acidobacteriota bacterium]